MSAAQFPPVGPPPSAKALLVSALLWPRPGGPDPGKVLALVLDEDIDDPSLAGVVKVIRSMVYAGDPVGPALVLDELRRCGSPKPVVDRLLQVTAAGAVPEVLRSYAAAVVAESLRRRVESAGAALIAGAESMAEVDLAPLAERATAGITDCAARLAKLRGEG